MRMTLNGRCGLALLIALGAGSVPRNAAAEELTFRLSWVRGIGAEGCPNAEQLAAAVTARLGRNAFSEPALRHIEGSVARSEQAWRVQLRVLDSSSAVVGSRDLEATGADCASVVDAVSLAIALTIDPHALEERREVPVAAPPELPAPPPPVSSPPPAAVATPIVAREAMSPPPRLRSAIVPRGLLAVGTLPQASFGAELGAELGLVPALGLTLGMAYLSEAHTSGAEFGLSLAAGSLGTCLRTLDERHAALKLCGELMAGAIQVVVYDPIPTDPGEHLWLAARLGPRFSWRFNRTLALELAPAAVVPLLREEFSIVGVEKAVFQTAPVSLLASLGLQVSIP